MPSIGIEATCKIRFCGETVDAVQRDDGIYVPMKPLVERMGLGWPAQHQRILRDTLLTDGVEIIRIPTPGGPQAMVCLRAEMLYGWLVNVEDSRIPDETTRERVVAAKREAYRVLGSVPLLLQRS